MCFRFDQTLSEITIFRREAVVGVLVWPVVRVCVWGGDVGGSYRMCGVSDCGVWAC